MAGGEDGGEFGLEGDVVSGGVEQELDGASAFAKAVNGFGFGDEGFDFIDKKLVVGIGFALPGGDFLWEFDGEGEVGIACSAVEFTVDEVCDSAEGDANWAGEGDEVGGVQFGEFVSIGEDDACEDDADDSAVACHTAFVECEDAPEGRFVVKLNEEMRFVEDAVAESAADDCSYGNGEDEVGGFSRRDEGALSVGEPTDDEEGGNESGDVRESIPADSEIVGELDCEWVELMEVGCQGHMASV